MTLDRRFEEALDFPVQAEPLIGAVVAMPIEATYHFLRALTLTALYPTAINVQFMVKNSVKYASTGGWGFAQFKDGKPANEAILKTCFPCHEPFKAGDLVFTHYSP